MNARADCMDVREMNPRWKAMMYGARKGIVEVGLLLHR